jgi:hypothetical protein
VGLGLRAGPDFGLGLSHFQAKVLQPCQVAPFSARTPDRAQASWKGAGGWCKRGEGPQTSVSEGGWNKLKGFEQFYLTGFELFYTKAKAIVWP